MFLILKLSISLLVTYLAIKLGEKVDVRYSALISSFPTIVALAILFIFLETGARDGIMSALTISYAIVLFNVWMLAYYFFIKTKPIFSVFFSIVIYFISAFLFYNLIQQDSFSLINYIPLILVFILGTLVMRSSPSSATKDSATKYTRSKFLYYMPYIIVPCIIVTITFINKHIGAVWAGIFASFPSTALVTTYYFHKTLGAVQTQKNLRHMFFYTGSFVMFGISIYFFSQLFGFIGGFIMGLLVTIFYAYIVNIKIINMLLDRYSRDTVRSKDSQPLSE